MVNEYELERQRRIERNKELLAKLGLGAGQTLLDATGFNKKQSPSERNVKKKIVVDPNQPARSSSRLQSKPKPIYVEPKVRPAKSNKKAKIEVESEEEEDEESSNDEATTAEEEEEDDTEGEQMIELEDDSDEDFHPRRSTRPKQSKPKRRHRSARSSSRLKEKAVDFSTYFDDSFDDSVFDFNEDSDNESRRRKTRSSSNNSKLSVSTRRSSRGKTIYDDDDDGSSTSNSKFKNKSIGPAPLPISKVQNPVILFSSVTPNEQIIQFIEDNGGSIVTLDDDNNNSSNSYTEEDPDNNENSNNNALSVFSNITHLVLHDSKIRRTEKFMCGISTVQHIVGFSWIEDSLENNYFLDEKLYPVQDHEAEEKYGFKLEESFKRREALLKQDKRVFSDTWFIITSNVSSPPAKTLKKVIECAGGKVAFYPRIPANIKSALEEAESNGDYDNDDNEEERSVADIMTQFEMQEQEAGDEKQTDSEEDEQQQQQQQQQQRNLFVVSCDEDADLCRTLKKELEQYQQQQQQQQQRRQSGKNKTSSSFAAVADLQVHFVYAEFVLSSVLKQQQQQPPPKQPAAGVTEAESSNSNNNNNQQRTTRRSSSGIASGSGTDSSFYMRL